jgi:hypothetical protein
MSRAPAGWVYPAASPSRARAFAPAALPAPRAILLDSPTCRRETAAVAALRAHLASARARAPGLDVIDTHPQRAPRPPARIRRKA